MLKKEKNAQLPLNTRKKENLKRNRECSMAAWIDNEHSCNVLKAFVPHRRQNSLEMTSTHILAVLIYQAQLWCWSSAESLGSFSCNKPQQWAHCYTLASRKSYQPVPVALWELHGVRRTRRLDHDTIMMRNLSAERKLLSFFCLFVCLFVNCVLLSLCATPWVNCSCL